MKRKLPAFLEAVILSLLCAWSGAGCLISAFSLRLSAQQPVLLTWLLWALLCGVLLFRRWGGALLLAVAAAGAVGLWYQGAFGTQLLSMLGTMAAAYDGGYGFGVPQVLQVEKTAADLPLLVLGMGMIFAVSRTVCRRRGNVLPVLLLLLTLATTLVVTDTVPEPVYLFGLLLALCLLLLTDSVRRENGIQASRLTAGVALPVALALGLLFYCFPQSGYVNTTQTLRENILQAVLELPQTLQGQGMHLLSGLRPRERVELSSLPTQLLLGIPVAEVTAEQTGPVYLRAQDYDVYTGTAWESSPNRQDVLAGSGAEEGIVHISLGSDQRNALLPAFPEGQVFLTNGGAEADRDSRENTYRLREFSLAAYPGDQWLALPEDTGSRARALIQSAGISTESVERTVENVADYVRSSAAYDRGGTTMAQGRQDFALWFLEEATQGYCVHFATAATVLLRSAGIPARYVTGYRVEAQSGEPVQVTSNDAHAWVEYYNYRTWGWYVLEATPTAAEELPAPTQTAPTQATQPATQPPATLPQTAAPTQPEAQPHQEEKTHWQVPAWIPLSLLAAGLTALAAELQRLLRLRLRRRSQARGDNNQRAAAYARELTLLSRLTGKPVPESLQELTEKAMFSQHLLTAEELRRYPACQRAYCRCLRQAPWWKKPVYRYYYAVI